MSLPGKQVLRTGRSLVGSAGEQLRRETWMRAAVFGLVIAFFAIALRMQMSAATGGDQAIFSYPAIVIATLLFGARAGMVAGAVCFLLLWYYVVPVRHSFAIADARSAITLLVYLIVGSSLIWAISTMRTALRRHRDLNIQLEQLVEHRTAERNRLWQRSRELLAIVYEDGCVHAANPALRDLLSLDSAALRTGTFESLLVEQDRSIYRQARDAHEGAFEARMATPMGTAWVAWSLVHDMGRFYLVGRDFTAEHECAERLRQSQKMELVGQMAGGLAHDFGNLVPPISMILHLLGKRHVEDMRTRELIGAAEQSVDRADKLIKRLLALSRPSRLEPATRETRTLLEEIAPLLRQVIGARELRLDISDDLPPIRVDANQLDMALLNLALNARDATPDGGVLQLAAARSTSGGVDIVVSDDGHGMDEETTARAAEPFFSTKPSGEGTGLGLPMVHNFAIAAGGSLSLESRIGGGTRARISLPAEAHPAPRALEAST